jgi:uncharacterized membrane protein (Fun14 family)
MTPLDQQTREPATIQPGSAVAGFAKSFFRSKLLLLALLMTAAGLTGLAMHKFTPDQIQKISGHSNPYWSLILFRIGISFSVAFIFIALVKKAVKTALLVGAALAGVAFLLNKFGVGVKNDYLANLQNLTTEGVETIQQTADSAWTAIKGYLPSGGAAGFGVWRGSRHSARL